MENRKESTHACEKKNQDKNKNTTCTHIQKKSGPKPRENFAEALFREPRRGTLVHTYTSNRQRFEATIALSDVTSNPFCTKPQALNQERNLVEITANPQGEDGWANARHPTFGLIV